MDAVDKLNKMKCGNCGTFDPEYFFNRDRVPLCRDCIAEILIDECNELCGICDLDDEEEVDVIDELWEEQVQYQNDIKNNTSK